MGPKSCDRPSTCIRTPRRPPSDSDGSPGLFAGGRVLELSLCGSGLVTCEKAEEEPGLINEILGAWCGPELPETEGMSFMGPTVPALPELLNEGFELCRTSLEPESGFDAEEFECGGDEAEVETVNGWYRSMVVGSDGVW